MLSTLRAIRWHKIRRTLKLLIFTAAFIALAVPEWPAFSDERYQIMTLVDLRRFDFFTWQINAMLAKGEAALGNGHAYLDEAARKEIVLHYLDTIGEVRQLEEALRVIYLDPEVDNPDVASRDLQLEIVQKRAALSELQPLAEAIVQEQVAAVLVDEGFEAARQAWPPVMIHMTPLPLMLIVSPRDHIERLYQVSLVPGMLAPAQEELESAVFETLDLSALVVPIGGLSTYPSMIMETGNINWLVEVTAHEWVHVWFGFSPVSLNYLTDPQVRVINETATSIVDQEIAAKVIARYYPEFVPPPPPESPPEPVRPRPGEPPPFDFRAEMAATRVQVDALLAEGKIEEAEAYMEARRQMFVENGYLIRKLNQAYFAFYGAYAAEPGGATGADPIGPLLRELRAHSPSIRTFLERVAPIDSFEALQEVVAQSAGE